MIDAIKQLREETGAAIGEIRSALEESGGDPRRARELLREKLWAIATRKSDRETRAGLVDAYVHANGKIGAMVEVHCETDFVARTGEFRELAHSIAMHIAAMDPKSADELSGQEYVRDPQRRVQDVVQEAAGKFGENIKIGILIRFAL